MADQRAQYNEEAVGANHPTKADVINRLALVEHGTDGVHGAAARASMGTAPLVLGSDADGDMYYRASGALARLAKGTANYKLFMNAAATEPQWASGAFMKSETRAMTAASGDVSYTGYGFKPSVLFLLAGKGSTKIWSIGIAFWTSSIVLAGQGGISADRIYTASGYLCTLWETDSKYQLATIKSMDADGFTLTWTKSETEPTTRTATLFFVALR